MVKVWPQWHDYGVMIEANDIVCERPVALEDMVCSVTFHSDQSAVVPVGPMPMSCLGAHIMFTF